MPSRLVGRAPGGLGANAGSPRASRRSAGRRLGRRPRRAAPAHARPGRHPAPPGACAVAASPSRLVGRVPGGLGANAGSPRASRRSAGRRLGRRPRRAAPVHARPGRHPAPPGACAVAASPSRHAVAPGRAGARRTRGERGFTSGVPPISHHTVRPAGRRRVSRIDRRARWSRPVGGLAGLGATRVRHGLAAGETPRRIAPHRRGARGESRMKQAVAPPRRDGRVVEGGGLENR